MGVALATTEDLAYLIASSLCVSPALEFYSLSNFQLVAAECLHLSYFSPCFTSLKALWWREPKVQSVLQALSFPLWRELSLPWGGGCNSVKSWRPAVKCFWLLGDSGLLSFMLNIILYLHKYFEVSSKRKVKK